MPTGVSEKKITKQQKKRENLLLLKLIKNKIQWNFNGSNT